VFEKYEQDLAPDGDRESPSVLPYKQKIEDIRKIKKWRMLFSYKLQTASTEKTIVTKTISCRYL
jgi:hypothetical protein